MTLLKLTAPGVPDVYQGDELESLNLVDPDNRRPVDWDARRRALDDRRRSSRSCSRRSRSGSGASSASTGRSRRRGRVRVPPRRRRRGRRALRAGIAPEVDLPSGGWRRCSIRRYPLRCSSAASSRSFASGVCTVMRIASSNGRTTSPGAAAARTAAARPRSVRRRSWCATAAAPGRARAAATSAARVPRSSRPRRADRSAASASAAETVETEPGALRSRSSRAVSASATA